MGGQVSGAMRNSEIETPEPVPAHESHRPRPRGNSTEAHNDLAPAQSQSSSSEVARETTKTVDQEVNERLAADPDFQNAQQEFEESKQLLEFYDLIDSTCGVQFNGNICRDDVLALVNDVNQPNKAARAAAKFLNDHPSIWSALSKGDAFVGRHDVIEYMASKKAAVDGLRSQAKADVQAERGIQTNRAPATGTGSATPPPAGGADQVIDEAKNGAAPKPPPSTRGGLEGAEENATNMMGWMEGEFDRLTALMAKTDDPKVQKQLEMQLNQLSRRMQSMTAMLNQLTTMMASISKMYADIAMNSIRNIR